LDDFGFLGDYVDEFCEDYVDFVDFIGFVVFDEVVGDLLIDLASDFELWVVGEVCLFVCVLVMVELVEIYCFAIYEVRDDFLVFFM